MRISRVLLLLAILMSRQFAATAQTGWFRIGTQHPLALFNVQNFTPDTVFVNAETGYPRERELYLTSYDGGRTWDSVWVGFPDAKAPFAAGVMRALSDSSGVLVGSYRDRSSDSMLSFIARTTDQGRSWRRVSTNVWSELSSIAAATSGELYVCGQEQWLGWSVLAKSSDQGVTWTWRRLPFTLRVLDLTFRDSLVAMMVYTQDGLYGLLRTTDAGETWSQGPLVGTVFDLEFAGGDVWLLSTREGISRSTDNGLTWQLVDANECSFKFAKINANEAFAFSTPLPSKCAAIKKSTDRGLSWHDQQATPSFASITSISVVNDTLAYASAADGIMLKTLDGGGLSAVIAEQSGIAHLIARRTAGDLELSFTPSTLERKLFMFNLRGQVVGIYPVEAGTSSVTIAARMPTGTYLLRLGSASVLFLFEN